MRSLITIAFLALFQLGCARATPIPPSPRGGEPSPAQVPQGEGESGSILEAPVSSSRVDESVPDDPELEALVAPYRKQMAQEVREVIGNVTGVLSKALPEGTLGNFATDAMIWAANRHFPEPVDMALTNNGGLRVPVGPGPITVGHMFELMPFDNILSVLVFDGDQVRELCDELAERRGSPIAGFRFRIEEEGGRRVAREIRIGGRPLDLEARYRLVTNDYMANGGTSLSPLLSPLSRTDLPVLLRDAFIDYVRYVGTIDPELQGRITGGIGP